MTKRIWPAIIQGGMGVAVSNWSLARAVSLVGQLGVVSGTSIDTVLMRRLQDGDPTGQMRRALAACPWPTLAEQVLKRFYLPHGRQPSQSYARLPLWTLDPNRWRTTLAVLGGFAEVWLAKAGHAGVVGINLLSKVALPNLAVIYGAMQAGVDVVLMGAGIPRDIPEALDRLSRHEPAMIRSEVVGMPAGEAPWIRFNPQEYDTGSTVALKRPAFFPIIAANSLATLMAKKSKGSIEGFVVEGPTAGGHNAPPRGIKQYDELGQPVYTARDMVDLDALARMGYPFWLAGGYGSASGLESAWAKGATGIQVGSLFAYCRESGLDSGLKRQVMQSLREGPVFVRTDPLASPTGFPFKVVEVEHTLSEPETYRQRQRICDLGYLREGFLDDRGRVRFRCAAEPIRDYVRKGGQLADTYGRKCLCNGLLSAAGLAQLQASGTEPAIVTSGDSLQEVRALIPADGTDYSARDVVEYLLRSAVAPQSGPVDPMPESSRRCEA
ncbi:MAG: nitronate monooxygenase [Thermaerobacter sp.]|nr:nitronate monooxygenase [Thermaerobacter sp.]